MTDGQKKWHRDACAQYKTEFPVYQIYARTLEQVLKTVCQSYAPLGIVQARAKTLSSFAEKMARKAALYMAPGRKPTDLCGARVITETQAEVEKVSEAIRTLFVIDEDNSVDVRTRLRASEFGYLSVHYVVQLRGTEILGIAIPSEIRDRKAEIQVRTLLQHAWASISHDRVYKSSFQVPPHLGRDLARVAAFLEEADARFGSCVSALDSYKLHYGAYMDAKRLEEEVGILEMVLASEPDETKRPMGALRLAQIARSTGDWERVQSVLEPFVSQAGQHQVEILAEHGHALCRAHADSPRDDSSRKGRQEIDEAVAGARGDLRTKALAYRAWASARIPDNEQQTRDFYREACEADQGNPFHLSSYVEYEIYCGEPFGFRAVMKPVLSEAIKKCRAYADAGIELPWAFLTMGRFHLLLDQPWESLAAYCKAIQLCLAGTKSILEPAIDAELVFLRRINRARELPETHIWVRDLLLLARSVGTGTKPGLAAKHTTFAPSVVIVAGGTAPDAAERIAGVRQNLLVAFEEFRGTIISGGTTAGIAGIAGEIADHLKTSGSASEVIGYLPRSLPVHEMADRRYTALVTTVGGDFGPREPLQYWADMLTAGITPENVNVLGVDGGRISALEYAMALAFGATLAIVEPASRSAAALCQDPEWRKQQGLIRLPNDAMTLRAFVSPPHTSLQADEVETAAQRIHDEFLAANRYKNPDPAMKPWPELRPDLKDSNRMQATRAAGFLELAGYRVERTPAPVALPELKPEEIEQMAEMEHGHWVVERIRAGWRFAPNRDAVNKLSPYLVSWHELSEEVKGYDRSAVRAWPGILAAAGLAVIRGPEPVRT
jgi:ppGpp synthetase/RelA/SpoT-type nucleotidyltranferase